MIYNKEKAEIEKQHQLDLLNAQLESQRQTMQHIGQEIHDSVAQKLTLASIYTQRMQFENRLEDSGQLGGISKIINDSLLELRQLSQSLTDNKMQHAELTDLVKRECEQVNATGICAAKLETGDIPSMGIAFKSSLLRILQEFIQNSIKHAACRTISIRLSVVENKLYMTIDDDGKGFDLEAARHHGAGLDNIRRRIQMLNGTCDFKSEKDKGTGLSLTVPLQTITGKL